MRRDEYSSGDDFSVVRWVHSYIKNLFGFGATWNKYGVRGKFGRTSFDPLKRFVDDLCANQKQTTDDMDLNDVSVTVCLIMELSRNVAELMVHEMDS